MSKYILDIPNNPEAPVSAQVQARRFQYDTFYDTLINRKKADKSYRYFRNVNRLAKEFPIAHSADQKKKVNVWCSNDYVSAISPISQLFSLDFS